MYGGLAHTNPDKHRVLESWRENPGLFPFLEFAFVILLYGVLKRIWHVRQITAVEINKPLAPSPFQVPHHWTELPSE